jgi:polar amino acid transport system substrate-binding protein
MKKRYIIILSCLFLLGMLTGCIQKDQLADGTKLIDKQKFIFAASGEFKPFIGRGVKETKNAAKTSCGKN